MVDKMSDFAEIEDVQIEMGDSPANPTTDNELDPIRELGNDNKPFSWNPKDWVNDAKRNYQEFAHNGYKLSEKTRVVSTVLLYPRVSQTRLFIVFFLPSENKNKLILPCI